MDAYLLSKEGVIDFRRETKAEEFISTTPALQERVL